MSWKRTATPVHEFILPIEYAEIMEKFILTYSQNGKPILVFTDEDVGSSVFYTSPVITVIMSQEDSAKFEPGEVIGELKLWTKDKRSIPSEDIPMYVRKVQNERIFE